MITYESICEKLGFDLDKFDKEMNEKMDTLGVDLAEDDQRFSYNPYDELTYEEIDFLEDRRKKQREANQ